MHTTNLSIDKNGLLRFKDRLYVPKSTKLKMMIMDKLNKNPYSGHRGYQKMIIALRKQFYFHNMENEIVEYLSKCLYC